MYYVFTFNSLIKRNKWRMLYTHNKWAREI